MKDISTQLQEQVKNAIETGKPLEISGNQSKAFYGRKPHGTRLNVSEHSGIINYEPTELVITARAGTKLTEIEATLASQNQILAFEPPYYGENATLGGTIAGNFSGPRRAYAGAARDFVLGCKLLNGKAEILQFGGEVMKNVAGYDVSRLMTGALGTLGVLLEISLKVLPKPETELSLVQNCSIESALKQLHEWGQTPLPISASYYHNNKLIIRLSGSSGAIAVAQKQLGGDIKNDADLFWQQLKEQQLNFFKSPESLWRLSLSSNTPEITELEGDWLYEWGGALRWLKSNAETEQIHEVAQQLGGHATLFKPINDTSKNQVFQPLPKGLMQIHKSLKTAFDPHHIFNIGRIYKEF